MAGDRENTDKRKIAARRLSIRKLSEKHFASGAAVSPQLLRNLQRDPRSGARELYRRLAKRFEGQRKESSRLDAMLQFERILWKAGIVHVAGVDEVGVGPLAGPVVAAAVIFPPHTAIGAIDDSKALDEESRQRLDREIRQRATAVGGGVVEVDEIDRLTIYHASLRAMRLALMDLDVPHQHVLVDSRTIPDISQPQNSFDKGDGINFSIASASIVAKVYRDRLMTNLDALYPGYDFTRNKGYATLGHQNAIRRLGPSPIHRRSFDYIRELCGQYSALYYEVKSRAGKITSRVEMTLWEQELRSLADALSEMENKKLHLMKNRLSKRIGG